MRVLGIIDEDFANYKLPSMFISTISCTWKCGEEYCQNRHLGNTPIIAVDDDVLISRYLSNPLTRAIVFGGLEPLDQAEEVEAFVRRLRERGDDSPVVIYSGYTADEAKPLYQSLLTIPRANIILKVGRYQPNRPSYYDERLGVTLISDNQYSIYISSREVRDEDKCN